MTTLRMLTEMSMDVPKWGRDTGTSTEDGLPDGFVEVRDGVWRRRKGRLEVEITKTGGRAFTCMAAFLQGVLGQGTSAVQAYESWLVEARESLRVARQWPGLDG